MGKDFTRRLVAFFMMSAVWFGTTAVFPVGTLAQDNSDAKQVEKSGKKR